MDSSFIIPTPAQAALECVLSQLQWLRSEYPNLTEDIAQVELVIRTWGLDGQPLPLTDAQAALMAVPGLWGVHRGPYEDYMARWKGQLYGRGRLGMPLI